MEDNRKMADGVEGSDDRCYKGGESRSAPQSAVAINGSLLRTLSVLHGESDEGCVGGIT